MKFIIKPELFFENIELNLKVSQANKIAELVHNKLSSLGIDVETPEKLRRLETIERVHEVTLVRLAELELMIAEAPVVYGIVDSMGESLGFGTSPLRLVTHRARLVQIEPIGNSQTTDIKHSHQCLQCSEMVQRNSIHQCKDEK